MNKILFPATLLTAALILASCSSGTTTPDVCATTAGTCTVTIAATGAPSGATYSVTGPGTAQSGAAGVKAIDKEGTWTVTPAAVSGYTVAPASAAVAISTSNKTPSVSFAYTAVSTVPTAPTIVSVSPANGSVGNIAGTPVVITFSKPMDALVTQGAYTSTGANPLGTVSSFIWTAGNTVLTITPTAPTVSSFLTGTAAGTPNKYSFSITTAAKSDAASGNLILGSQLDVTFSTAVKHTGVSIVTDSTKTLSVDFGTLASYACGGNLCIGDTTADNQAAAYLTFDLTPLNMLSADLQPNSFLTAPLVATDTGSLGNPFGNLISGGEALQLYSVKFGDPVGAPLGFWTPFQNLLAANKIAGNFGPVSALTYTADVKTQLQADWTNRAAQNNLSQYQVRFAKPVFTGGGAEQLKINNAPTLMVDYLANK